MNTDFYRYPAKMKGLFLGAEDRGKSEDGDLSELCKRQSCDAATSAEKTVSAQEPLLRTSVNLDTISLKTALLLCSFRHSVL